MFWQLALLVIFGLLEGHLHTRGKKAQRSKKTLCTWKDVSHCREKILQVAAHSTDV